MNNQDLETKLRRLQRLLMVVIVLLIASQIMSLLFSLIGFAVGIIGAVFTIAVSWFATRKARQGARSTIWFMLPPLVFTGIPLTLKFFPGFIGGGEEQILTLQSLLLSNLPFLLGFIAPVAMLLWGYWRLSVYLKNNFSSSE